MNFAEKAAQLFNKDVKHPSFKTGDTVSVHVKVKEGEKERIQIFKGNVIKVQGAGIGRSFTVRKMSGQFGVERTWPMHSPAIDKIDLVARGKVRRSKIFYLRDLKGRAARIKSEMVIEAKGAKAKKKKEVAAKVETPAPAAAKKKSKAAATEKSDSQSSVIIGVDEVGRGCLFGPVVSAAVVLGEDYKELGLTDSKKLTAKKREEITKKLHSGNHMISVGHASPLEIDQLNILQASLLSMKRAVLGLDVDLLEVENILIDGIYKIPGLDSKVSQVTIIKGDLKEPSIAAASIIAKVYRDKLMDDFEEIYPGYGLKGHKGYPTKVHKQALIELGATPEHRRSFKGVAELLS